MTQVRLRTGGQLLMDSLVGLGATRGFGVPGESYLAVLDAMVDHASAFDLVLCRQEGGAAYMAAAWGKLTGAPGLCFVTRGPGATNATVGIHTAMQDSVPMILFVGQVGTDVKGREAFQEVDYAAFFTPLAKWAVEIDHVDRVPEIMSRAWTVALSGRPGPVVVALPEDMLVATSEALPCGPVVIPEPSPSASDVAAIKARLDAAERPVILLGGTRWTDKAARAMEGFATANDVPVVAAFRFHDIIDNGCAAYVGDAGVAMNGYMKTLLREADLILAVNIRFGELTTDGYSLFTAPRMAATLIHSHASDGEIGKIYTPDLPIHAGPNAMAAALATITLADSSTRTAWYEAARADYLASLTPPAQPGDVDMGVITAQIQKMLPADAIVTHGAGNFSIWPNKFLTYGRDQRLLGPQSGSMGFGLPAALAAKVHDPSRFVLCFAGDGDFQMNGTELGTALQSGLNPVILIINNSSYGTIRMHQERHYPTRVSGTEIVNPDYMAIAAAYGFHGERVIRTEEFTAAWERACAAPSGAIVEIVTATEAISPRTTISALRAAATE
ncbi:thiamine pyrophosphate-dependent enzyme [Alphaproteobacteria bacterium LSUCC0719]